MCVCVCLLNGVWARYVPFCFLFFLWCCRHRRYCLLLLFVCSHFRPPSPIISEQARLAQGVRYNRLLFFSILFIQWHSRTKKLHHLIGRHGSCRRVNQYLSRLGCGGEEKFNYVRASTSDFFKRQCQCQVWCWMTKTTTPMRRTILIHRDAKTKPRM